MIVPFLLPGRAVKVWPLLYLWPLFVRANGTQTAQTAARLMADLAFGALEEETQMNTDERG